MALTIEMGERTDVICRRCKQPVLTTGAFDPDPNHQDPKREPSVMHAACATATHNEMVEARRREENRKLDAYPELLGILKRLVRRIDQGKRITPDLKIIGSARELIAKAEVKSKPLVLPESGWRGSGKRDPLGGYPGDSLGG